MHAFCSKMEPLCLYFLGAVFVDGGIVGCFFLASGVAFPFDLGVVFSIMSNWPPDSVYSEDMLFPINSLRFSWRVMMECSEIQTAYNKCYSGPFRSTQIDAICLMDLARELAWGRCEFLGDNSQFINKIC